MIPGRAVLTVTGMSLRVRSMIIFERLAFASLAFRYSLILVSSTSLLEKSLPPYQLESHPLMIPTLLPIGLTFCPIFYSEIFSTSCFLLPSSRVIWFDLLRIRYALPCGAVCILRRIRPPSTCTSLIYRLLSSRRIPSFFACQLAMAERRSFSTLRELSLVLNLRISRALLTSCPLIMSVTYTHLRGEVGTLRRTALVLSFAASFLTPALILFLAPISDSFSVIKIHYLISVSHHDRGRCW